VVTENGLAQEAGISVLKCHSRERSPERRFVPLWMVKEQHMSVETADSAAE
jgi:hypothetical protein